MFEPLSDQIRADDLKEVSTRERIVRYAVISVLSVVLFGALYFAVRMTS